MSKNFQYPIGPIGPGALPLNLAGDAYDLNIYARETTQRHTYGRRFITWDGRVFKYFNAGGVCYTGQLNAFYLDKAIATTSAAAVVAGSNEIKFASQSFAENALAGGYISIFGNPGGLVGNADCPHRGVLGNTYASTSTVTIYLDAPLDRDVDNAQFCEVYYNPYSDIRKASGGAQSVAGLAARYMSASGQKGWIQTYGPNWAAPHVASFKSGEYRQAYAHGDGSISGGYNETITGLQPIGFIIPSGLTAGPLLMLQISI